MKPDSPTQTSRMGRADTARGYGLESKFEVLGTLGSGGMGTVLKARHRAMDRLRAVKLLDARHRRGTEVLERFRREATIASDLSHPNIVKVFDFDYAPDGTPYISMELLEGEDLEHLAAREAPLPLEQVVELLSGVAEALDQVHALGVVHRDIKPANLFLTREGVVKILDFGISHVESEGTGLTAEGQILGTPVYMAPEQVQGMAADHRTDVYALAAVAYELLTGHRAVAATSPMALLHEVMMKTPRPAIEVHPSLPSYASEALQRGLAKDPEDRFSSAAELVRAIAGNITLGNASTNLAVYTTGRAMPSARRFGATGRAKRKRVVVLAIAAVMALAVGVGLYARPGELSPNTTTTSTPIHPILALLPPSVDVTSTDQEWERDATSALTEQLLSLDDRVRLVARDETARLVRSASPAASSGLEAEIPAKLAASTGATAAVRTTVIRGDDSTKVRFTVEDLTTHDTVFNQAFEGDGLDAALEKGTRALVDALFGGVPHATVTPEMVARCGVTDDRCHDILALERALIVHGARQRALQLAEGLKATPDTAVWPVIVNYPACVMRAAPAECLRDVRLPAPPDGLSAERKALWGEFAKVARGEKGSAEELSRLVRSDDALVRNLSQLLPEYTMTADTLRIACQHADTHLDRHNCMNTSLLLDDRKTTFHYYQQLAQKDWCEPNVVSAFSIVPMAQDLAYAERCLQRARLRGGDRNPYVTNALSILYVALRRPSEAILWARRSPHPLVREGFALELEGHIKGGYEKTLKGVLEILSPFPKLPEDVVGQMLRPWFVPPLVLHSPELARLWLDILKPIREKSEAFDTAAVLLEGLRDGKPPPCDTRDASLERLRIEVLYLCNRPAELIEEARRRDEKGLQERASRFYVAEAHLALGKTDRARELFAAVESDASLRSGQPVFTTLALERLGRIDDDHGRVEEALKNYDLLLKFWDRVDVAVPEVDRARTRAAALRGSR